MYIYIRKICIFARGQIYRADQRENLHNGIHRWVSPLRGLPMGGDVFGEFVFDVRSFGDLHHVQLIVHSCVAVPFMSGYRLLRLHGVVIVVGSHVVS